MEQDTLNIFDRFYRNEMSREEAEEFLKSLEQEPGKRVQFEEYLVTTAGINSYERQRLKMMLQSKTSGRQLVLKPFVAIAAVVLLLLVPGILLYRYMTSSDRLYQEYYYEDPGLAVTMGGTATDWDVAFTEYKDGHYDKAAGIFLTILRSKPGNDTASYYAGVCYHLTGQFTKSTEMLDQITESSVYYYASKYYAGLTLLKLQKYGQAAEAMKIAASCESCEFKDKAAALAAELE